MPLLFPPDLYSSLIFTLGNLESYKTAYPFKGTFLIHLEIISVKRIKTLRCVDAVLDYNKE